jgi:hypothetical protein
MHCVEDQNGAQYFSVSFDSTNLSRSLYNPLIQMGLSRLLSVSSIKEPAINFLRAALNLSLSIEMLHNISKGKSGKTEFSKDLIVTN